MRGESDYNLKFYFQFCGYGCVATTTQCRQKICCFFNLFIETVIECVVF